jgi:REP element-mobilizing transposase RayT
MMTEAFYRRNLPHWQSEERTIFVTWRLHGSFPEGFVAHLRSWHGDARKQFLNSERVLDSGSIGPLWLKDPEIAAIVENAILHGVELGHYRLRAYVVMPNHVHALFEPLVSLHKLMGGIKGASARYANLRLGRTGKTFWQDESFDRWVRDEAEFVRTKSYIENNPVKAGLCAKPEAWPWSSAHAKLAQPDHG